ncbi:MAG: hypothetical protein JWN76_2388 [Chitinophagaceae bacterium]|nr:hypothetical protein [Chitinophagaceae bacterium]
MQASVNKQEFLVNRRLIRGAYAAKMHQQSCISDFFLYAWNTICYPLLNITVKKVFVLIGMISAALIACKISSEKKPPVVVHKDTELVSKNIPEITPTMSHLSAPTRTAFNAVFSSYLALKDALANGDESEARSKGRDLEKALHNVESAGLNTEEKKVFQQEAPDAIENAEHIGRSELDHQRMHFASLSESIYNLARTYGAANTLYRIDCAKAQGGNGAGWLTQAIDHKNPYLKNENDSCYDISEKINSTH